MGLLTTSRNPPMPAGLPQRTGRSKTRSAAEVRAAAHAGARHFGENYLDEAKTKIGALSQLEPGLDIVWHYIGAIQSNKTREIARRFDWVHTVDRPKIARRLDTILDDMPLEQRCVFVLTEIEELRSHEVAEALDIPRGTVASRLRRAREIFEAAAARLRRERR